MKDLNMIYEELYLKLKESIFQKRPAQQMKTLEKGKEAFISIDNLGEKAKVINEIITMFRCDATTVANLKAINGSQNAGSMKVKKNTLTSKSLKEKEAFKICQEKIRKHGLDMKLIEAEYTFDNNKVLFYFTADGRIDFRELVKDLAAVFRTRIELRQIGVRDETKIRGGIGICGRPLCCSTYLTEFAAVSIKMAKEQNLSLNPTKISGVCGRLMCCLTNEEETYEVLNSQLPSVGDNVTTSDGLTGTVHSLSVLRRLVKVIVNLENDEKEIREYKADDLKFRPRRKKQKVSKEEQKKLAALERMEKKEGASKLDDK